MYELIQVGKNTFYVNSPSKVGIYRIDSGNIYLIDSGNNEESAKKLLKIIYENSWNVLSIINTHSHADHIGGNQFLQKKLNCPIYSPETEVCFIENVAFESSFLYGGYPYKDLRNKFLMAKPSKAEDIEKLSLPEGMEYIYLNGHAISMIAIKTPDNIWFVADSVLSKTVIEKYHISYVYDLGEYLKSLDKVQQLEGRLFIPSHAEPAAEMTELIEINRNKAYEIIDIIIEICKNPSSFEEIFKQIFDRYNLIMDSNQYVLGGSTIRSYLSYLYDIQKLKIIFEKNRMLWCSGE